MKSLPRTASRWWLPALGLLALGLSACDSDSEAGPSVTETVPVTGGEVAIPDGRARLVIPPGALAQDQEITVTVVSGSGVSNLATDLIELGPTGLVFQTPVTLVIPVPAGVATEGLYLAKLIGGQPVAVTGSRFSTATRELQGELTSFSRYGGFKPATPDDIADCRDCAETYCGPQVEACNAQPDCQDILGCIDNCIPTGAAPETCFETCRAQDPEGHALFDTMMSCAMQHCSHCLEGDGLSPPNGDDECEDCIDTGCAAQLTACEAQPACDAILDCLEFCAPDDMDDCVEACALANPGGAAAFEVFVTCIMTSCQTECMGEEEQPGDIQSISFNGTLYIHPEDSILGANTVWGLPDRYVGATSETDGATNTATTVANMGNIGNHFAAKLCAELDSADFTDWYLPAKDELAAIYQNRAFLGMNDPLVYWSSTESGAESGWSHDFADGQQRAIDKGLQARVRCVRRP